MAAAPVVPTLYWPSPCPGITDGGLAEGVIVGWATGEHAFVAAGVVPATAAAVEATVAALRTLQRGGGYADLAHACAGVPCILGHWSSSPAPSESSSSLPAGGCCASAAARIADAATYLASLPAVHDGIECKHPTLCVHAGSAPPPPAAATPGAPLWAAAALSPVAAAAPVDTSAALASLPRVCAFLPPAAAVSWQQTRGAGAGAGTAADAAGAPPPSRAVTPLVPQAVSIVLYEPASPLTLHAFSSRPLRVPGVHALGATAVVKVSPEPLATAFDCVLNQLNAAHFVGGMVCSAAAAAASASSTAGASAPAAAPLSLEDAARARAGVCRRAARRLMTPALYVLLLLRGCAVAILGGLQWRLPARVPLLGGVAPYEVSTFARQLHLKLCEFCTWPHTLVRLHARQRDILRRSAWHSTEALYRDTAAWYDYLHRSLFDVVVGVTVCALFAFAPWAVRLVLTTIHTIGRNTHIDVLRVWIDWLMGLPVGLKLNHFAGRKIGGAVLSVIDLWEHITTVLTPFEPLIVLVVGLFGLGGISLLLAVTSDVLDFTTMHLYTLYAQFAWLHNQQMGLLGSLWRLFRGKKTNVLRNRVDSNDYDIAQLLLGTLFFTVVFFVFPTTLVYYVFFHGVWLCILAVRALVWWILTFINNLPAYTLYCAAFAPRQLPGDVRLSAIATTTPPPPPSVGAGASKPHSGGLATTWYRLHSQPASAALAAAPFARAVAVVMQRYSVGSILRTIVLGEQSVSLFRSVGVPTRIGGGAGPGASPASGTVGASGFGGGNAAANAPTEGPAPPTARATRTAITERGDIGDTAVGSWRDFLAEVHSIADVGMFGL